MSTAMSLTPPRLRMLGVEPLRAASEFARMHLMNHDAASTGDGHAVVLFPGLGTDPKSMAPLSKHCERRGYVCYDWGRGTNTGPTGDPHAWITELANDVAQRVRSHREGVSLIGCSLGGLYAREIAKAMPRRVGEVITLGSPLASLPELTSDGSTRC